MWPGCGRNCGRDFRAAVARVSPLPFLLPEFLPDHCRAVAGTLPEMGGGHLTVLGSSVERVARAFCGVPLPEIWPELWPEIWPESFAVLAGDVAADWDEAV